MAESTVGRYRICGSTQRDTVLSQLNPVHTLTVYYKQEGRQQRVRIPVNKFFRPLPVQRTLSLCHSARNFVLYERVGWDKGTVRKQNGQRCMQDGRWPHVPSAHVFVSCAIPVGNLSWVLIQEGRSSRFSKAGELGRPHTLSIIPTSSVLEFIVHKHWTVLIQMNCSEFNSRNLVSLH
jgi:hypothetical protein